MSKKRSRTIFSRSGDPSGTFQSGDPDPQRPSWVPKRPSWSAQGPLKGHPGGPRAPLDHPCEFRPCTVIFENLRFSSFTHISNVFSTCFDYHSCFTNFHLSHFTHIPNVFSTIYQTTTFPRSLLWTLESIFGISKSAQVSLKSAQVSLKSAQVSPKSAQVSAKSADLG